VHLSPIWYVALGVLGLVFGSFFNVAIHRWPKEAKAEREWVKTPSHCPKCGAPIRWYDNIPVFSWLALGGKCRDCKAPISPRYIIVEVATGLLWILTGWLTSAYGFTGLDAAGMTTVHLVFALVFASFYFLTVVIDAQTQIIPDEVAIPLFIAAWAFYFAAKPLVITPNWQSSLICMLAFPAVFFIFAWLGWMGMGDVMLAAGFGVLFGWPLTAIVILLGFLLGGVVSVPIMGYLIAKRRYKVGTHAIAFGPYLATSAYVCLFFGKEIAGWYLHLFNLQLNPNWTVTSSTPIMLLRLLH
jgi:leader peptidase (prepilin peptidase)/N-methyltransferase